MRMSILRTTCRGFDLNVSSTRLRTCGVLLTSKTDVSKDSAEDSVRARFAEAVKRAVVLSVVDC